MSDRALPKFILGLSGVMARLFLLISAGYLLSNFVEFAVTKDFFSGKFSPDADSIGIPIFGAQILILGALVFSSPIALLGSEYLRTLFFQRSKIAKAILLLVFSGCYFVLFFISLSGLEGITNETYRERWFDGVALFAIAVLFLSLDVARLVLSNHSEDRTVTNKILNLMPL